MDPETLPLAPHTMAEWFQSYESGGPLRGFRCPSCGFVTATWGLACMRCGHVGLEEQLLPPRGTVAAFTLLHVPGDEFLNDAPYVYAVVELEGGGRITAWFPTVRTVEGIAIGDRVRFQPSYKPGVQFVAEAIPTAPPGAA
jgi:uncharacterized OB-fold protein